MFNSPLNTIRENFDYRFNIIILGSSYSGKSSVVRRYIHDSFKEEHTLFRGYECENKLLEINNKLVKLGIYDKYNPSSRCIPLSELYYKSRDGAIIVYDCDSFENEIFLFERTIKEIK